MQKKPKPQKNDRGKKRRLSNSSENEEGTSTRVGDISGGKGFAIGSNAKSIFIEIGSLFDLSVLQKTLKQHWVFLAINTIFQGTTIAFWQYYTDRFLIPAWILMAGIILIEISLVSIYVSAMRPRQRWIFSALGITSLLGLIGLTSFEYNRVVHPPKFDVEIFGVAVAQFGEGPDLHNTDQARDVSQAVLQQLIQQAQENPDLSFVQFRPIGLVRTQDQASTDAHRIGADLVIWGQLQVSEEKTILNFSIIETPDKVSNPMFPRVLPLFEPAATGFVRISGQGSEEISKGTTAISAFTFGLAHFFKWDFGKAALAFEEAPITSLEAGDDYRYLLHLYYGLSLQWPGQLEKADEEFQKAIDLHPEDPAPRIARAFGYNSWGRIAEAQEEATRARKLCSDRIQLNPNDYKAFFDRALANEILKDWNSALADYQSTKKIAPDLYITYIGILRMYLILDQVQDAITVAQEAIELAESRDANPAWAYLYLAHAYERNNDVDNAQLAHETATSLAPRVDWIHFQAGQFYANIGNLATAEREYKLMIEVTSNKAWAYSTLAEFYAINKRFKEAIIAYRDALRINPSISGIWVALADIYEQLGQVGEVYSSYSQAVKEEPDNFYARFKYGNFLYTQGKLENALSQWEVAYQIDSQQCDLLFNLGLAHEMLGDIEQAKAYYVQTLSLDEKTNSECIAEAKSQLERFEP